MSARNISYVALAISLSCMAFLSESYTLTYTLIVALLLSQILFFSNISQKFLALIFLVYLSIALLNISTYRNLISYQTISIYLIFVLCVFMPISLASKRAQRQVVEYYPSKLTNIFIIGHIAIAWIALAYVYARYGNVAVDQDERFGIPTSIGYTIRSVQFIPAYMVICRSFKEFPLGFWRLSFLSIAPSILLASRSTAVLAIMAIILLVMSLDSYKWPRPQFFGKNVAIKKSNLVVLISVLAVFSLLFIGGGFYVRRSSTTELMDGVDFVRQYFGEDASIFAYILAPFHQGFNETAALTSRVVDYPIVNYFTSTPLLWADFDNLLGLSDISAAQFFGNYIGRAQGGGLTPGLVGGVLLDFRDTFVLWFLGLGVFTAALFRRSLRSRRALCLYAIYCTQLIHLFHRGFVKPEYLTIFLIAAIYLATLKAHKIAQAN